MERLANTGYLALKKQSSKDTAVTPNVYVPLYEESLLTNLNLDEDNPIMGNKFARFQNIMGMRSHNGDVKVLAEPNTAGYLLDMLYTKGSTTGADPYTHPFTLSNVTDPNAYTVDIARGQIVFRFIGVEASQLGIEFDENKMLFNIAMSARKALSVVKISGNTTGTLVLYTDYDPAPTTGFVVNDLVRIFKADGSVVDTTVSSITDGTTIVVASATGVADGDYMALRAATPSYSLLTPFMWGRTEFRFGASASAALSASQTRIETGSVYTLMHNMEDVEGAKRSGSFDPAGFPRTQGDVELTTKIFFDTPEDLARFMAVSKRSLVIRHFSGTAHELRVTLNNINIKEHNINDNSGEIIYAEIVWSPRYDTSDGQAMDVKVINAVSSI